MSGTTDIATEMAGLHDELRTEIVKVRAEVRTQVAILNSRLDLILYRLLLVFGIGLVLAIFLAVTIAKLWH